jgi:hypothetical protein
MESDVISHNIFNNNDSREHVNAYFVLEILTYKYVYFVLENLTYKYEGTIFTTVGLN